MLWMNFCMILSGLNSVVCCVWLMMWMIGARGSIWTSISFRRVFASLCVRFMLMCFSF